ncbi:MAG: Hsp20/alpha crystallin family protein [Anaerolineae bacterium]|nr:Hsp20/alpha crystallin family protein [Anaerolineae bacterium]
MAKRKTEREEGIRVDFGLGGVFKGIGNFIDLLSDMVEEGESEVSRHGEFKVKGLDQARGVYGFNVRMGLGGTPTVEHFGNIRATNEGPVVAEEWEPLVDVFDEGELILVVAELPGVDKDNIQIEVQDDILSLSTTGDRKYVKELLLPSLVDPATMETSYRNGVLEVRLHKAS